MSEVLQAELVALEAMPDDTIDTSDIAPVSDWSGARRGMLYRPVKQQLSLRLDADVVAWFKDAGDGYQTRINRALREYVESHSQKRA
ncbi:MAG: BrnA antitoxin family protein [Asticcacaulis sp.]|nr:BrnA antitoxin family protein [Asticcacaulis sp.]